MLEFLNLQPEVFGLDISDLSLKIVKLKKRGKFLNLASFGDFPIKEGILTTGEIKDEEGLVKTIKEAVIGVKGERIKTRYVVVSLPEEKAFLQVIQMPLMEKEELARAILFEVENYIPLPINEIYLDFQVVKPVYNHLNHLDVLISALPKKTIDPYVKIFKKAGLKPFGLEIEAQATARALIKDWTTPFPVLIIDLGATRTGFIIFSGHSLRFTSSISVCGKTFTEMLVKNFKISSERAEKLKTRYGLEQKKVFEALVPPLTDLIEQIKKYLNYYQSHSSHEHLFPNSKGVGKILLCGGGANLKGIEDFLYSQLKIPIELGNPWINVLSTPIKEVPMVSFKESLGSATAIGLALGGIIEKSYD